jgi:hypothetical protein
MAAIMQQSAQEVSAARAFWRGLRSHGPLKRFFEWFFEGLAIVTVPAIIICSIVIAGALSAPSAFANAAGQALIALAIILMNAAIEGAMLGCAVAAKRTGLKRLYWTAIVFLVLTIATIGFAVFHVDAQWSQVLLWIRCSVALVFACVSHMSDAPSAITPAQPAPAQPLDYAEIARQLLPTLRGEISLLSEQVVNLQAVQITAQSAPVDEPEQENIVNLQSYREVHPCEPSDEPETRPTPRITVNLKPERSAAKRETTREPAKGSGTAQEKAARILKRTPEITASELAKRAGCTPQYAGRLIKKQSVN